MPEYWIINLRDDVLEIHRQPKGDAYRQVETPRAGQTASPLATASCTVAVADLLP